MDTVFIEATEKTLFNHGKFLVGRMTEEEWARPQQVGTINRSLLSQRGWYGKNIVVMDLQTGEGAIFKPGGWAEADLQKTRIWVCPLFEPFLTWLYTQDLTDLTKLPVVIDLGDVPTNMRGYRRTGGENDTE